MLYVLVRACLWHGIPQPASAGCPACANAARGFGAAPAEGSDFRAKLFCLYGADSTRPCPASLCLPARLSRVGIGPAPPPPRRLCLLPRGTVLSPRRALLGCPTVVFDGAAALCAVAPSVPCHPCLPCLCLTDAAACGVKHLNPVGALPAFAPPPRRSRE